MKGYLGHGLLRVGAGVPQVEVGDPAKNREEILKLVTEANQKNCGVFVLPELCLTGYTCRDLFEQKALLGAARESLGKLMEKTAEIDTLLVTGLPLRLRGNLFNCAVLSYRGKPLGITAKSYLPNYREFYEKRQFRSGASASWRTAELLGEEVPFGSSVFQSEIDGYQLGVGIEICEDLWAPIPPSSYLALRGANLILNPSASNALIGKRKYRHQLIAQQSARALCGYVYAGSGPTESTTDTVYEGEALISENGKILNSSPPSPGAQSSSSPK